MDGRWQPGAIICCGNGRLYEAVMPENHSRNYGLAEGVLRRRPRRRNYGCGDGFMEEGLFVAAGGRSRWDVQSGFTRAERGGIRWLSASVVNASQLLEALAWLGR